MGANQTLCWAGMHAGLPCHLLARDVELGVGPPAHQQHRQAGGPASLARELRHLSRQLLGPLSRDPGVGAGWGRQGLARHAAHPLRRMGAQILEGGEMPPSHPFPSSTVALEAGAKEKLSGRI